MKKYLSLFLLFFLIQCSETPKEEDGSRQSATPADIVVLQQWLREADSLRTAKNTEAALVLNTRALKLSGTDSLRGRVLTQRIALLRADGHMDSVLMYTRELKRLGETLKDTALIANAWFRLGFYLRSMGQQEASAENYFRALETYKTLNDSAQVAAMSTNLSNLLNSMGNFNAAERIAVSGLQYDPANAFKQQPALYNALAISASNRDFYSEARYWYQKALPLAIKPQDKVVLLNNIADTYEEEENTDRSVYILDSLLQRTPWESEDISVAEKARVLLNLGESYELAGTRDALPLFEQARELFMASTDLRGQESTAFALARHYIKKDTQKSLAFAKEALRLGERLKNPVKQLEHLKLLIDLDPQNASYSQAYATLADSLLTARSRAAESFARLEYDSEQNRTQNFRLEKEAAEQSLELQRTRNRNWTMGIVFLSLLALIGVGIKLQRSRHKLERLEAASDTEARISRKIHDELANDVFHAMTFTEAQKDFGPAQREHLMDQLDQIYQRTRNISRDNAPLPEEIPFDRLLHSMIGRFQGQQMRLIIKGLSQVPWNAYTNQQKTVIYRSVQELLVNAKKHSGASLVLVDFTHTPKQVTIKVKDNGAGASLETMAHRNGLSNLEKRLSLAGGRFTFTTAPGKGFEGVIYLEC